MPLLPSHLPASPCAAYFESSVFVEVSFLLTSEAEIIWELNCESSLCEVPLECLDPCPLPQLCAARCQVLSVSETRSLQNQVPEWT